MDWEGRLAGCRGGCSHCCSPGRSSGAFTNDGSLPSSSFSFTGIVAANVAGLPRGHIHNYALTYLVSRAVYSVVYIIGDSPFLANVRTLAYLTGVGSIFTSFITAGIQFNKVLLR